MRARGAGAGQCFSSGGVGRQRKQHSRRVLSVLSGHMHFCSVAKTSYVMLCCMPSQVLCTLASAARSPGPGKQWPTSGAALLWIYMCTPRTAGALWSTVSLCACVPLQPEMHRWPVTGRPGPRCGLLPRTRAFQAWQERREAARQALCQSGDPLPTLPHVTRPAAGGRTSRRGRSGARRRARRWPRRRPRCWPTRRPASPTCACWTRLPPTPTPWCAMLDVYGHLICAPPCLPATGFLILLRGPLDIRELHLGLRLHPQRPV